MKNKDKGIVNSAANIVELATDIRKIIDIAEVLNRSEIRLLTIAILENANRIMGDEEKNEH